MVTNQIMVRKLGSFDVLQRTKDDFFDGNALLSQWNKEFGFKNRRKMSEFLESTNTIEFIKALREDLLQENENTQVFDNQQRGKIDLPDNQVVRIIKGRTSKDGKKALDQVWMHPYLFIDFAMWINPKFKLKVIQFVYDELIKNRHDAGDGYRQLISALVKLPNCDIPKTAKAIQYIVFNKTGKNLRNNATKEQLKEIVDIENKLTFAIDMNFITSFEQLMFEMRKIFKIKYNVG